MMVAVFNFFVLATMKGTNYQTFTKYLIGGILDHNNFD